MIERYFQSTLDLLASQPFVHSSDVNLEKRGDLVGFIRGRVEFQDGSTLLFFRELVDLRLPVQRLMYAYHYQKEDGTLIFRYDNTEHHSSIATFPHHKHSGIDDVISSDAPTLERVLLEIENLIEGE
ncbi:MAG: hypothetical protein DYG85_06955 [Chloroflexi bacterium CFX1]|nr:hypothetical protein [Chloroflexi bacterium CFX1]MDL1919409.1 hypothetical protein [Chloroflexi bacterium CFX5]NUQ58199.1 hypothetical protein [Anaerolineales bacterium]